jgi:hypothetical protein
MGIPSDGARSSRQALARKWSLAFYGHPAGVDGIVYPSRLNGEINLAVYDRSVTKLEPLHGYNLKHAAGIADVLDDFLVALI